jgi:hypothetical protein
MKTLRACSLIGLLLTGAVSFSGCATTAHGGGDDSANKPEFKNYWDDLSTGQKIVYCLFLPMLIYRP